MVELEELRSPDHTAIQQQQHHQQQQEEVQKQVLEREQPRNSIKENAAEAVEAESLLRSNGGHVETEVSVRAYSSL